MIAVAIAGMLLGGERLYHRRSSYRNQALLASLYVQVEELFPDTNPRRVALWKRLQAKYERAARYPWLHVEPDPTEP